MPRSTCSANNDKTPGLRVPIDYAVVVANVGVLDNQMNVDGIVIRPQFGNDGDVYRAINAYDHGFVEYVGAGIVSERIVCRLILAEERYVAVSAYLREWCPFRFA